MPLNIDSTTSLMKKSLSYVDLKKEIETIMPISKREEENVRRACFMGRRKSKSFRQFPKIVVVPPDGDLTTSMPDIHKTLKTERKPNNLNLILNNVWDKNMSCPDLADSTLFKTPDPNDFNGGSPLERQTRQRRTNSPSVLETQRGYKKIRKRRIGIATEVVKRNWKAKQSKSMHNLLKDLPKIRVKEQNYHTIHASDQFFRTATPSHIYSSAENLLRRVDSPQVKCSCACYRSSSHCCDHNNTWWDSHVTATSCCDHVLMRNHPSACSLARWACPRYVEAWPVPKKAVPIQVYLETYFDSETVRFKAARRGLTICIEGC